MNLNLILVPLAIYALFLVFCHLANLEFFTSPASITLYDTNWCPASLAFRPTWEQFVARRPNIKLNHVRCEGDNEQMCQQLKITGFPTVKLVTKSGREVEFTGERTVDALLKFANSA